MHTSANISTNTPTNTLATPSQSSAPKTPALFIDHSRDVEDNDVYSIPIEVAPEIPVFYEIPLSVADLSELFLLSITGNDLGLLDALHHHPSNQISELGEAVFVVYQRTAQIMYEAWTLFTLTPETPFQAKFCKLLQEVNP